MLNDRIMQGIGKVLGSIIREVRQALEKRIDDGDAALKREIQELKIENAERRRVDEEHQRRLDSYRKHLDNHENKIKRLIDGESESPAPWPGKTSVK